MNLKINDDYVTEIGEYLRNGYEDMKEFVDQYCAIMYELSEKGIIEGETHEAIIEFADQVQAFSDYKDSSMMSMGSKYHTYCNEFIREIKKADRGLYGS